MAIAYVSSGGADASSAAATVNAGEICILTALRAPGNTVPSLPSGDWSTITSGGTVSTLEDCGMRVAWRVGPFSGTGTWTNAHQVCFSIYTGFKVASPIGLVSINVNSSEQTYLRYPARTLSGGESGQWIILGAGRTVASAIVDNNPSGALNRIAIAAGGSGTDYHSGMHDTNGPRLTDYPQNDVTGAAGSSDHICYAFELLAEPEGAGGNLGDRRFQRHGHEGVRSSGRGIGREGVVQCRYGSFEKKGQLYVHSGPRIIPARKVA